MTQQAEVLTAVPVAVQAVPAVAPPVPVPAPTSLQAAPAAIPAPLVAPVVAATSAAPPDPVWLKSRLDREHEKATRDLLAKTGFATVEEAAVASKLAREHAQASMTADEKAKAAETALSNEKARADQALAFATEHAARMMIGLTPEQQEAVRAIAGDDPVRQGRTILQLAPTWAKAEAAQIVAAAGTVVAPVVPIIAPTTAPANAAPNGTVPTPGDPRQQYEAARKTNPFEAAAFGQANPSIFVPKK